MKNVVGAGCPDKDLADILQKCNWDTNQAVEYYFMNGLSDKYASSQGS
jgi:hypothetical protein